MRVGFVASGVGGVIEIDLAFRPSFRLMSPEESLLLLGIDVLNESLPGLEVVAEVFRLILLTALFEDGFAMQLSEGVPDSRSMHDGAVEVDNNAVGHKFDVGVVDLGLAVEEDVLVVEVEDDGVLGLVCHGMVERFLPLALDGILCRGDGVVPLSGKRVSFGSCLRRLHSIGGIVADAVSLLDLFP